MKLFKIWAAGLTVIITGLLFQSAFIGLGIGMVAALSVGLLE